MKTIFADTNVVIDLLEKREPFCKDAVRLFTLAYKVNCEFMSLVAHSPLLPTYCASTVQRR